MLTVLLWIVMLSIIYSISYGMLLSIISTLKKPESEYSPISGTFMFYITLLGLCIILMGKLFLWW
jgi:hypothetical protein